MGKSACGRKVQRESPEGAYKRKDSEGVVLHVSAGSLTQPLLEFEGGPKRFFPSLPASEDEGVGRRTQPKAHFQFIDFFD